MGDLNQLRYIRMHAHRLDGPYLEVGSKDYGSTPDLRSVFPGSRTYIGADLSEGDGVDVVVDFADDFDAIDGALGGERFGTIFCLSVLEHCSNPFVMADNLTRLLRPGGKAVISVPFAWPFHGYPSDYWRFTHEGVLKLFPGLAFDLSQGMTATPSSRRFNPVDARAGVISFGTKDNWAHGRYVRGITSKAFKVLGKMGIFRWLSGNGYVLAPTMVNLIGTLKAVEPSE